MTGRVNKILVWTAIACALAFAALAILAQCGLYDLGWLSGVPLSIGLASLLALACSFARHRGRLRVAMFAGIVAAIIGAALVSLGYIAGFLSYHGARVPLIDDLSEDLVNGGGVVLAASIVMAQWGMLALLRLEWRGSHVARAAAQYTALLSLTLATIDYFTGDGRHDLFFATIIVMVQLGAFLAYLHVRRSGWRVNRFAQYGAIIFLVTLALVISQWELLQWLGELARDAGWAFLGLDDFTGEAALMALILTIVTAGLALLEHLKRRERAGSLRPQSVEIELVCPRCHLKQMIHTGSDACRACGLRFSLQIEEPFCECGYLLYQLHDGQCPECGRVIPHGERWMAAVPISTDPTHP